MERTCFGAEPTELGADCFDDESEDGVHCGGEEYGCNDGRGNSVEGRGLVLDPGVCVWNVCGECVTYCIKKPLRLRGLMLLHNRALHPRISPRPHVAVVGSSHQSRGLMRTACPMWMTGRKCIPCQRSGLY